MSKKNCVATYFEKYPEKRPIRTLEYKDKPEWHGDAIYDTNNPATTKRLLSSHSGCKKMCKSNAEHDLGGRFVLLSDHFIYFGQKTLPPHPLIEDLCKGRNYKKKYLPTTLDQLTELLNEDWKRRFDNPLQTGITQEDRDAVYSGLALG